ncbi:hypothetical protein EVAR_69544_1 [Eumeta japonica]|uniref:Secreted protein n=1 Tax=Eumeta variegata TaxID=151549 RepID=A0A4C2A6I6_EUMVA|nr:hypothetical protein EVAR_69544_1 [Eumeta japonica]
MDYLRWLLIGVVLFILFSKLHTVANQRNGREELTLLCDVTFTFDDQRGFENSSGHICVNVAICEFKKVLNAARHNLNIFPKKRENFQTTDEALSPPWPSVVF